MKDFDTLERTKPCTWCWLRGGRQAQCRIVELIHLTRVLEIILNILAILGDAAQLFSICASQYTVYCSLFTIHCSRPWEQSQALPSLGDRRRSKKVQVVGLCHELPQNVRGNRLNRRRSFTFSGNGQTNGTCFGFWSFLSEKRKTAWDTEFRIWNEKPQ